MGDGRKRDRLLPVTVRFSQEAWEAIRDMAKSSHMSQAELVRMAVVGNLNRYLGDVRILDPDQAEEIRRQVIGLFDAVSRTGSELHRIGVNYNQEVRAINAEAKRGNGTGRDGMAYPKSEVDDVIERYERAARKAGEALCRILM